MYYGNTPDQGNFEGNDYVTLLKICAHTTLNKCEKARGHIMEACSVNYDMLPFCIVSAQLYELSKNFYKNQQHKR